MALVPVSPWVCLRCGIVDHGQFAPDCCDDQFAIQIRVDVPGRPVAMPAPVDVDVLEEVEA